MYLNSVHFQKMYMFLGLNILGYPGAGGSCL
jgi:hypothetical protein